MPVLLCAVGGNDTVTAQTTYEIRVRLHTLHRRDGRQWLIWCPAIDVMTQARTKKLARESLRDAVELWFESCIERGVLNEALKELGFVETPLSEKEAIVNINQMAPEDNANKIIIRKKIQKVTLPQKASFRVAHGKWSDFIDGTIPAYVAAQQLGDVHLARG